MELELRIADDEAGPGTDESVNGPAGSLLYLHEEVILDESDVDSAYVTIQQGRPALEILLTPAGSRKWEESTSRNVGKRCGIILNGDLVSAPRIMAPILVGRAIVAGDFNEAEARRMARRLNEQASGGTNVHQGSGR